MRGRQQLHVDLPGRGAADRPHDLVVQEAQQRCLQRQRQLAHFVEQQRAAVGPGDEPGAALAARAGEGTAHITEQLGLDQLGRQRTAVHRDEGAGAAAALVQVARQHFLAAAGLALDQHRHVQAHGGFGQAVGGHHGRVVVHRAGGGGRGGRRGCCRRCRSSHRGAARRLACGRAQQLRHQRAAQAVAQALRPLPLQPRQHQVEGFAEQRLEGRAGAGVQALQQLPRAGVQRLQRAAAVEGQQPGAERAQELGPRVQRQQPVAAHLVLQQAVLDVRGRHLHQCLRVVLARGEVARRVEHADDVAAGVVHRRGSARDVAQAQVEVLQARDGHRAAGGQRRAQAVGAAQRLAPAAAGDDGGAVVAHREAVVGVEVEDHALAVGKGEQEVRTRDLL